MKIFQAQTEQIPPNVYEELAQTIDRGGIACYPTDTCYGLAGDAYNKSAIALLHEIKGMPADKPISVLVSDMEMAARLVVVSPKAQTLMDRFWPGPLTIILPKAASCPPFLNKGLDTVAIRMADDLFSRFLCAKLDTPLLTTSANPHGGPVPYEISTISTDFQKKQPDFVIDAGEIDKNPPSTIISLTKNKLAIVRKGPISRQKLK